MSAGVTDPFEEQLAAWRAYVVQPWARIRYAVAASVLERELSGRAPGLRVLDVGGGDGLDSIPLAGLGHEVTIVDTAPGMLAEAGRRAAEAGVADRVVTVEASLDDLGALGGEGFDVVLCHFVLHYRPAEAQADDVRRLAAQLRPGGLLSVIAPNPDARALGTLVRHGPAAALEALASEEWASQTFQHSGRLMPVAQFTPDLVGAGLEVVGHYGGRIANDLLTADALKHDPAYFDDLLRLELQLSDREPYKRLGFFWQLVARSS